MLLLGAALDARRPAGAAPSPAASSFLAAPFDTGLAQMVAGSGQGDERITVMGRRLRLPAAPIPDYRGAAAPWEAARAIRDPRTGADTTSFGNAFNLGSPLGSDERSNETGGALVAPRHP